MTDRKALIETTLATRFRWLRFPAALEQEFTAVHARRSVPVIRRVLPWIGLLYLLAVAVMWGVTDAAAWNLWRDNALWPVALALGGFAVVAGTRLLERAVHLMTGLAISIALFATARTVFLLGDDPAAVYVTYQVIYLLFIVFTITRLRFYMAIGWVTLAGAAALTAAVIARADTGWLAFTQYYAASALISAVIGYVMEYRDRADWLKSQQIELEKQELAALRARSEAENRRQRQLADFLQRTGGNLTATEIAGRALAFLVEQAQAQVGVVFLAQGDRLRRAASWGLDGERGVEDLGRGETLIGQAAEGRRRLRLTHLPADYHPIRTATGAASPAELLVLPVCSEQATLAVIELGALQAFSEDALALADEVVRAMAALLVAAQARDALARAGMDEFVI